VYYNATNLSTVDNSSQLWNELHVASMPLNSSSQFGASEMVELNVGLASHRVYNVLYENVAYCSFSSSWVHLLGSGQSATTTPFSTPAVTATESSRTGMFFFAKEPVFDDARRKRTTTRSESGTLLTLVVIVPSPLVHHIFVGTSSN